jgi:hypothetical protein
MFFSKQTITKSNSKQNGKNYRMQMGYLPVSWDELDWLLRQAIPIECMQK